jgi:hypothetical protein
MSQIMLDAALAQHLKTSQGPLDLCGPGGELLGQFTPAPKPKIKVPFTEEAIKRSKQKPGGRPLADILSDLEKDEMDRSLEAGCRKRPRRALGHLC